MGKYCAYADGYSYWFGSYLKKNYAYRGYGMCLQVYALGGMLILIGKSAVKKLFPGRSAVYRYFRGFIRYGML